jgi:hypothetical protein
LYSSSVKPTRGFGRAALFVKTHQPGLFVQLDQPTTPPTRAAFRPFANFVVDSLTIAACRQEFDRVHLDPKNITAVRYGGARRAALPSPESAGAGDIGAGARDEEWAAAVIRAGRASHVKHLRHDNLLEY